jgi:hypothetical protein
MAFVGMDGRVGYANRTHHTRQLRLPRINHFSLLRCVL